MSIRWLPYLLLLLALFLSQPFSAGADDDPNTPAELRGPLGIGTITPAPGTTQSTTDGTTSLPPATTAGTAANNTLRGLANITTVTATAKALETKPLPRIRDEDIKFVEIRLRNDSQQVVVINGDAAQAVVGTGTLPAAGGHYLVDSARPGMTKTQFAVVAAVFIGSASIDGPIVYEYVTAGQHRKRSLGMAIGIDGTRHQVEAERFGVRVLMPGDQSVGWMAFSCEPDQTIHNVTIPLSFSRSLTPDGVLKVPVETSTGQAPKNVPPAASPAATAPQLAPQPIAPPLQSTPELTPQISPHP